MSLKISRTFSDRSSRVKSVDLHPSEPWMLVSLYDGHLVVYNYQTGQKVKEWEVSGGTPGISRLSSPCSRFPLIFLHSSLRGLHSSKTMGYLRC